MRGCGSRCGLERGHPREHGRGRLWGSRRWARRRGARGCGWRNHHSILRRRHRGRAGGHARWRGRAQLRRLYRSASLRGEARMHRLRRRRHRHGRARGQRGCNRWTLARRSVRRRRRRSREVRVDAEARTARADATAGRWRAGVCGAGVDAVKSSSMRPRSPIAITPPHTEHRARTPASGILAGSTRKTELHSGQVTFMRSCSCESFSDHRSETPTGEPRIGSCRRSTT